MRVAVIGGGVAGLVAARQLSSVHEVHLFEAQEMVGGHARTVYVEEGTRRFPVDMGFIVFNRPNYPCFSRLLRELEVPSAPSCMGFSVSDRSSDLEYSGESLAHLFAAPANALRPDFWRMLRDFRRFCRQGRRSMARNDSGDLDSFCRDQGFSSAFRRWFLDPMAGAIWSTPPDRVGRIPAATLLRFFDNHGLLSLTGRPDWLTIPGGSRRYVDALLGTLNAEVYLSSPVDRIERSSDFVRITSRGDTALFDQVVLAVHSDQALALLASPSPQEREILGSIRYRRNDAVLHCDVSALPRRRRAWTSWNVRLDDQLRDEIAVTYLMNKLQPLPTRTPWCVSLNQTERLDPRKIHTRARFDHPQFDEAAIEAQERWSEISGARRTHYCGAYWRYGFHEDGAWSGYRAATAVAHGEEQAA